MKPSIPRLIPLILALIAPGLFAQSIQTAENFFDETAARYGEINDYIADITITTDRNSMSGTLYYKSPNLLRIDFSTPAEQTVVTDGRRLTIYLPQHRVIMNQTLRRMSSVSGAAIAGRQGLTLLKRNYSIGYLDGPTPVPLEPGSDERVTKLRLAWRSTEEGFRQLDISVGASGLIRRIVGVTVAYQTVQFDFRNIRTNQNIPAARFNYDPPATANVVENFLFEPDG